VQCSMWIGHAHAIVLDVDLNIMHMHQ